MRKAGILIRNGITYRRDVAFSFLTTMRTGGNAELVIYPSTLRELMQCLDEVTSSNIPFLVLGNGSDVIAVDKGFSGVVIKPAGIFSKVSFDIPEWLDGSFCGYLDYDVESNFSPTKKPLHCRAQSKEKRFVFAGCNALLASVYMFFRKNNLHGGEFLRCIPACTGGAVVNNAGCFSQCISDILSCVVVTDGRKIFTMDKSQLELGYRHSVFHRRKELVILGAVFCAENGFDHTFAEEIFLKKKRIQPLSLPSAGSVFKRKDDFSPAWAIDKLGMKGFRVGDAEVSKVHSGFIVNIGSARAKDVQELMRILRRRIYDEFEVTVFPEVIFVGDGANEINAELNDKLQ